MCFSLITRRLNIGALSKINSAYSWIFMPMVCYDFLSGNQSSVICTRYLFAKKFIPDQDQQLFASFLFGKVWKWHQGVCACILFFTDWIKVEFHSHVSRLLKTILLRFWMSEQISRSKHLDSHEKNLAQLVFFYVSNTESSVLNLSLSLPRLQVKFCAVCLCLFKYNLYKTNSQWALALELPCSELVLQLWGYFLF